MFSTEEAIHPRPEGPSIGPAQLDDDSVKCVAFVPSCSQAPRAPNREKITELMKHISCFIKREAPRGTLFDHPTSFSGPRW